MPAPFRVTEATPAGLTLAPASHEYEMTREEAEALHEILGTYLAEHPAPEPVRAFKVGDRVLAQDPDLFIYEPTPGTVVEVRRDPDTPPYEVILDPPARLGLVRRDGALPFHEHELQPLIEPAHAPGSLLRFDPADQSRTYTATPGALARVLPPRPFQSPRDVRVEWFAGKAGTQDDGVYRAIDFEAFEGWEIGDEVVVSVGGGQETTGVVIGRNGHDWPHVRIGSGYGYFHPDRLTARSRTEPRPLRVGDRVKGYDSEGVLASVAPEYRGPGDCKVRWESGTLRRFGTLEATLSKLERA